MPAPDGVLPIGDRRDLRSASTRAKHATLAASLSGLACVSMSNQAGKALPMRDVATLLEALPYIREFHGRTVVIKYGGAAMEDERLREEFARDVVLLKYVGLNPIVVHGGGPEITGYMKRLGLPVEFVGGLRVSDESTVEVAKMVLVGKVNKEIVLRLSRHEQSGGVLSGVAGLLIRR